MTRSFRIATVLTIAMVIAAYAAPMAVAKRGGKKPVGTIESFDGTTLTLTRADGSSYTGEVAPYAQVKVEHRGNHTRGRGHGNPSNGSLCDLEAGVLVLRFKAYEEEITKIRIRRPAVETARRGHGNGDGEDSDVVTDCSESLPDETEGDGGDTGLEEGKENDEDELDEEDEDEGDDDGDEESLDSVSEDSVSEESVDEESADEGSNDEGSEDESAGDGGSPDGESDDCLENPDDCEGSGT